MIMRFTGLVACLVALLSGCQNWTPTNPESSPWGGGRVQIASSNQLLSPDLEQFDDNRLLNLIDPLNYANTPSHDLSTMSKADREYYIGKAFFHANTGSSYGKDHRNQIQDTLMMSSENRCNVYFTYLKRLSVNSNALFGTLTTVLGGAGAIVTGETAARILSGSAGIMSGTRAELNQAFFQSVATSVIIPGIKASRTKIRDEINLKKSKAITEYTVQAAIADAVRYNGECSMDTGLDFARKTMFLYEDVGLNSFINTQRQVEIARNNLDVLASDSVNGPIISISIVNSVGSQVTEKMASLKSEVAEQKKVKDEGQVLLDKLKKDAIYEKEATELDTELKEALFTFVNTQGIAKKDALRVIEEQQIKAKNFEQKLEAEKQLFLVNYKAATAT